MAEPVFFAGFFFTHFFYVAIQRIDRGTSLRNAIHNHVDTPELFIPAQLTLKVPYFGQV